MGWYWMILGSNQWPQNNEVRVDYQNLPWTGTHWYTSIYKTDRFLHGSGSLLALPCKKVLVQSQKSPRSRSIILVGSLGYVVGSDEKLQGDDVLWRLFGAQNLQVQKCEKKHLPSSKPSKLGWCPMFKWHPQAVEPHIDTDSLSALILRHIRPMYISYHILMIWLVSLIFHPYFRQLESSDRKGWWKYCKNWRTILSRNGDFPSPVGLSGCHQFVHNVGKIRHPRNLEDAFCACLNDLGSFQNHPGNSFLILAALVPYLLAVVEPGHLFAPAISATSHEPPEAHAGLLAEPFDRIATLFQLLDVDQA